MLLRTRDLLMRQRTQVINALRWHLAELGIVAANSYCHVRGRLPIALALPVSLSRKLIERFFDEIKQCRRIATRYDKLAVNYLAFIKLASIRMAPC
jgi:transposase